MSRAFQLNEAMNHRLNVHPLSSSRVALLRSRDYSRLCSICICAHLPKRITFCLRGFATGSIISHRSQIGNVERDITNRAFMFCLDPMRNRSSVGYHSMKRVNGVGLIHYDVGNSPSPNDLSFCESISLPCQAKFLHLPLGQPQIRCHDMRTWHPASAAIFKLDLGDQNLVR